MPEYVGLAREAYRAARGMKFMWTGKVHFIPARLAEPLRKRKPSSIAVALMGDLFHEEVTNEQIAAVSGVMAATPQHRYYVLTKRAKRMREWFEWITMEAIQCNARRGMSEPARCLVEAQRLTESPDLRQNVARTCEASWPLPNVALGVSVENQAAAEERIPELLRTPAKIRFLSMEPLLGPVDLSEWIELIDHCNRCEAENPPQVEDRCPKCGVSGTLIGTTGLAQAERYRTGERYDETSAEGRADIGGTTPYLYWIIVGGESGPSARPCHVDWIRSIVRQCRDAGVSCFVKQLGSNCIDRNDGMIPPKGWPAPGGSFRFTPLVAGDFRAHLRDRAGGDPNEWPADLRVMEFPEVKR